MDAFMKPGNKKRVVLAFGSAFSPWLLGMYRPLARAFDVKILASRRYPGEPLVEPVKTAGSFLDRLPGIANRSIRLLWQGFAPYYDRIIGLSRHLRGACIVHTVEIHSRDSYEAARNKRAFGYKHVVTVWENLAHLYAGVPGMARIKRTVLAHADMFIAVTERARTALLLEGVEEGRIAVIPAGVEPRALAPKRRMSAGRTVEILMVAQRERTKGVAELLSALYLLKRDPDLGKYRIRMNFLGITPSRGRYAALVRKYGLAGMITETASVPHREVDRFYGKADLFVLPSLIHPMWQEQFGMAFLEAMGHGLPIVTTWSGSIPEVAGDAALYAQPNDHHSLYRKLKDAIRDPLLRARLSRAGRARLKRFDARVISKRISKVYERLCR
jgi:glycosyltransferase involved in cell wall biosynthesis